MDNNKPDFEQIASFRSDIADHSMFLGFKSGCEHVWNTHVVTLQKKVEDLQRVLDIQVQTVNDALHVNLKQENRIRMRLESENKALQEKIKIADHIKELDDDAIVTLQKENDLRGRQLDHYRDQTQKVRTFVFNRNDIGKANQNIFEAVNDHIYKLESENKALREEIERLKGVVKTKDKLLESIESDFKEKCEEIESIKPYLPYSMRKK